MEPFDRLVSAVQACTLCPRMCSSLRVLNRGCGALDASVLFIGEAPGRLGADVTALPFHGDKSGHNFEELLGIAGLSRYEIFVTNAVLCNPRDEKGNNAPPTAGELENCSAHLRRQIDLIQPKLVVTLGANALRAAMLIENRGLSLAASVRSSVTWYDRHLVPLYHPGQRAMIHRSMANQRSDYRFVGDFVRRLGKPARNSGKADFNAVRLVERIIRELRCTTYFKLHKIFYLVEYEHQRRLGRRLTDAYIVRQKDGPYCVDLHPAKLKGAAVEFSKLAGDLLVRAAAHDLFSAQVEGFGGESERVIEDVISRVGNLPSERLKTVVYMTSPMRALLRQERMGANLYNVPVLD